VKHLLATIFSAQDALRDLALSKSGEGWETF